MYLYMRIIGEAERHCLSERNVNNRLGATRLISFTELQSEYVKCCQNEVSLD